VIYSHFEDAILAALYQEQVFFDQVDMISFSSLVEKYGLEAKPGWLIDAQKELLSQGLISGPRNGSNDQMALGKIDSAGRRKIEDENMTHDGVGMILEPANDVDRIYAKVIPASDRVVTPNHNQSALTDAVDAISKAEDAVSSSNILSLEDKSDTLLHISLGKQLLTKGKSIAVGAVRYLVLDRLKKAFERLIEDALKLVLIAAFLAVAALILSLI
jgi:hypothetical protein